MASWSWQRCENSNHLRDGLAVFQPIRKDAQRKSLDAVDRFVAAWAVGQYSGKFRDFSQPPAVVFLFDINSQRHN
jgi:hypothetical protein